MISTLSFPIAAKKRNSTRNLSYTSSTSWPNSTIAITFSSSKLVKAKTSTYGWVRHPMAQPSRCISKISTQWRNFTSQGTASVALDQFSPSLPISLPPLTYKSSKYCWHTFSAFQKALANPNRSLTISWASQLLMERSGFGAIRSTKPPFRKLMTQFQSLQPPRPPKTPQQRNPKQLNWSEATRRYHLSRLVLASSLPPLSFLSRVLEGRSYTKTRNSWARTKYVVRLDWARRVDIMSARPRGRIGKGGKGNWGSERERANMRGMSLVMRCSLHDTLSNLPQVTYSQHQRGACQSGSRLRGHPPLHNRLKKKQQQL